MLPVWLELPRVAMDGETSLLTTTPWRCALSFSFSLDSATILNAFSFLSFVSLSFCMPLSFLNIVSLILFCISCCCYFSISLYPPSLLHLNTFFLIFFSVLSMLVFPLLHIYYSLFQTPSLESTFSLMRLLELRLLLSLTLSFSHSLSFLSTLPFTLISSLLSVYSLPSFVLFLHKLLPLSLNSLLPFFFTL